MAEDTRVRDQLATERTRLAEERTYLAYIRTGMSILLGGVFFVGYFEQSSIFWFVGLVTIAVAIVFLGYGFYKHGKSKNIIGKIIGKEK